MANTFTLIGSNTTSTGSSVTFSGISSTYTDLLLMISARTTYTLDPYAPLNVTFNSISSGYSEKVGYGSPANGTSGRSDGSSGNSQFQYMYVDSNTATSNTFATVEIYIPNYAGSNAKNISYEYNPENNSANTNFGVGTGLNTSTAAITSITISAAGQSFVSGSSFYLYGIKNS